MPHDFRFLVDCYTLVLKYKSLKANLFDVFTRLFIVLLNQIKCKMSIIDPQPALNTVNCHYYQPSDIP